ncbi:MAG: DoxX family protein [Candidatus Methanosuratincola sp.]|jgi:putative oxidoreductase
MVRRLLRTESDVAPLIARVALGVVILPHGLQKLLGLYGGAGFSGTMDFFVQQGMPSAIAFLVIVGESFGAAGLILGFITRLCSLGITLIMLGAVFMVHQQHGFFMNWYGQKGGEGFEYHILAIGLGLISLIKGGGALSVDRAITGEG